MRSSYSPACSGGTCIPQGGTSQQLDSLANRVTCHLACGEFIRRAQERRRDFTVDWVHLKLNDQAQRTVLRKDPFRSVDERVEKLIAGM